MVANTAATTVMRAVGMTPMRPVSTSEKMRHMIGPNKAMKARKMNGPETMTCSVTGTMNDRPSTP